MPSAGRGRGGKKTHARSRVSESLQSLHESDLSSAPLPPHYAVTLAHPHVPSKAELHAAYARGAECISDVVGALQQPLVPIVRRCGLWGDASHHPPRAGSSSSKPLWRTATLSYPCTCNLPQWPFAYTPPIPPPTTAELRALPEPDDPSQVPLFGDDVPAWSTLADEKVDLDMSLDSLGDFEHEWGQATPWPVRDKGKGRAAPEPSPPRTSSSLLPSQELPPSLIEHPPSTAPAPPTFPWPGGRGTSLAPPASGNGAPPSSFVLEPMVEPAPGDYVADAVRRRAWWRQETREGYGAFWDGLQRTTWASPFVPASERVHATQRADAYRVPRNLHALEHPLHPDIGHYCAHARARVYWLIPLHGPVVLPRHEDPVVQDGARPWASRAYFHADTPETGEPARPAVVHWTPQLLETFLRDRFEPLWCDPARPYGPLHLAFSGPKPDPYLALPPPTPLTNHDHVPPTARHRTPVRPEAGDHFRIYVDARRAMSLRTWLHWWEVDRAAVGAGTGTYRPFDRARFVLVGPRGEALVVA